MEVTLGMQIESKEAQGYSRIHKHVNQTFARCFSQFQLKQVDEIAMILRIGSLKQEFGSAGVSGRRFMKSKKYVSINIILNESDFAKDSDGTYLLSLIEQALLECSQKLKTLSDFDIQRFTSCVNKFKTTYLKSLDQWRSQPTNRHVRFVELMQQNPELSVEEIESMLD